MVVDLRSVESQRAKPEPIPTGIYCLEATVKRGGAGEGGVLKQAKNGRSLMLELECTVVGGEHHGRKIWDYVTVDFDENNSRSDVTPVKADELDRYRTSVRLGLIKMRAIIDSAFALDPKDHSEAADAKRQLKTYEDLNGLTFYAEVDIKESDKFGPRNTIDFIITPDLPDWPKQPIVASKHSPGASVRPDFVIILKYEKVNKG